jgi:hypothetical protein
MMSNKLSGVHKLFFGLSVLLLAACSLLGPVEPSGAAPGRTPLATPEKIFISNPAEMDKSWLTGQPCQAPCWYGLTPGKATSRDVLEKIKLLTFINPQKVEQGKSNRWNGKSLVLETYFSLVGVNPAGQKYVLINMGQDVVDSIGIYPNYQVSFKETVAALGAPDWVSYSASSENGNDCVLTLFWNKRQLDVSTYQDSAGLSQPELCDQIRQNNGQIPPGLDVQTVTYWQNSTYSEIIQGAQSWNGFLEK